MRRTTGRPRAISSPSPGAAFSTSSGTEVDSFGQSDAIDIEFSPDGKKIAFSVLEVVETGAEFIGIYIVDLEEILRERIVVADGFVAYLDWRPLPADDDD